MDKYYHGGDIYSREIMYDFSASINPLGMPESSVNALMSDISKLEAYPDPECGELINAVAEYENTKKEYILCGNGASDLICRIVNSLKPKKALLTAPSFSEYARALKNIGCEIKYETLYEENGFAITESALKKISDADIFFLCSPNNPVGNTVAPELLYEIVKKCSETGTQLIIDECFMDFVIDNEKLSAKKYIDSGVIILKAFTKIFAMAGLRLGYIICGDRLILDKISSSGCCWSVSAAAQIAGAAAVCQSGYIKETMEYVKAERDFLIDEIEKFGFKIFPPEANFIFFKSQYDIEEKLLERKIAIRNCENYKGLQKGFFRIAVRTHKENVKLISEIERILQND